MAAHRRVQSKAVDAAIRVVDGLRAKDGMLGRAARAMDDELSLRYLADRLRLEDELIDRFVGSVPVLGGDRVSLVVPVYGIPVPYLAELFDGVKAQTYTDWEVCLCDDGDPDEEVRRYLEKLSQADSRFRLSRHADNRGVSAATNTALGLATGELIAFVDADDLLHKRTLEVVVAAFGRGPDVDFVYTDNDHATDLGHRRSPLRKPGWSPELLQCVNYVNHLVVVRRSCLDRCSNLFAPKTSGGQDWDLCLKASKQARRIVHAPLPLYHWRKRPGSIAADLEAKPWVASACREVRLEDLRQLDPRLTLRPVAETELYRHHLEPDFDAGCDLPTVSVIVVDAPSDSARPFLQDYRGWQRVQHLLTDAAETNGALIERITAALRTDEADFALFLDGGRPPPEGELTRLLAFAVQPAIGCVWPFHDENQRLAYTVGERERLVQLSESTTVFSRFSGNVLTGPLHGMLVAPDRWLGAVEWLERLGEPGVSFQDSPRSNDAVGAAVGLAMRASGHRNVGCRGMCCGVDDLPEVLVPTALLGGPDPYC